MTVQTIYRSSNGDDWLLERDAAGAAIVVHRANPASGGAETRMPADEFLDRNAGSPQAQALRDALANDRNR